MTRVRVHYPGGRGRLSLRTDADWERDIHPIHSTSSEAHEFEIETERPFVYFKAVLVTGSECRFSEPKKLRRDK